MTAGNESVYSAMKRLLANPIPDRSDLRKVAVAAGQMVEQIDIFGDERPIPVCKTQRRIAGIVAKVLEISGRDFYDYTIEIGESRPTVSSYYKKALHLSVDCILLEQVVLRSGAFPGGELRSYKTKSVVAKCNKTLKSLFWEHNSIKRHFKNAEKQLGIIVETFDTPELIREVLPTIARLHRERWEFDGQRSALSEHGRIKQYSVAAEGAIVTLVRSGKEILAIHYGLKVGRTLIWHTPAINIAYLDASPLEILLGAVAESCDAKNISELDFGLGDEAYKARFATQGRDVYEYVLPLTFRGWLIVLLRGKLKVERWRQTSNTVLDFLRGARKQLRQRASRVRHFQFEAKAASNSSDASYREVQDWSEFVALLRRFGMGIKRYQYDRFRNKARFVCLEDGDRLLCQGWVWPGDKRFTVGETGREMAPDGSCILYDFSTPVSLRRQGYYVRLLRAVCAAHADDRPKIFARTSNAASISGILRVGFVES